MDVTSSALVTDFYRLTIVQPHDDEVDAFERFAHAQPNNVVLLLDTYDTEMAAEKMVALGPRLRDQGSGSRACASIAAPG